MICNKNISMVLGFVLFLACSAQPPKSGKVQLAKNLEVNQQLQPEDLVNMINFWVGKEVLKPDNGANPDNQERNAKGNDSNGVGEFLWNYRIPISLGMLYLFLRWVFSFSN